MAEKKKKKIQQIIISTGKVKNTWKSTKEASKKLNIPEENIKQCLLGKRDRVLGCYWKYEGGK